MTQSSLCTSFALKYYFFRFKGIIYLLCFVHILYEIVWLFPPVEHKKNISFHYSLAKAAIVMYVFLLNTDYSILCPAFWMKSKQSPHGNHPKSLQTFSFQEKGLHESQCIKICVGSFISSVVSGDCWNLFLWWFRRILSFLKFCVLTSWPYCFSQVSASLFYLFILHCICSIVQNTFEIIHQI